MLATPRRAPMAIAAAAACASSAALLAIMKLAENALGELLLLLLSGQASDTGQTDPRQLYLIIRINKLYMRMTHNFGAENGGIVWWVSWVRAARTDWQSSGRGRLDRKQLTESDQPVSHYGCVLKDAKTQLIQPGNINSGDRQT